MSVGPAVLVSESFFHAVLEISDHPYHSEGLRQRGFTGSIWVPGLRKVFVTNLDLTLNLGVFLKFISVRNAELFDYLLDYPWIRDSSRSPPACSTS